MAHALASVQQVLAGVRHALVSAQQVLAGIQALVRAQSDVGLQVLAGVHVLAGKQEPASVQVVAYNHVLAISQVLAGLQTLALETPKPALASGLPLSSLLCPELSESTIVVTCMHALHGIALCALPVL